MRLETKPFNALEIFDHTGSAGGTARDHPFAAIGKSTSRRGREGPHVTRHSLSMCVYLVCQASAKRDWYKHYLTIESAKAIWTPPARSIRTLTTGRYHNRSALCQM